MRKALICGILGQDGAYLSKLLIDKGYEVVGIGRRSSQPTGDRLKEIFEDDTPPVRIAWGDILDHSFLQKVINDSFDEVYNLSAQSDVAVSFDAPDYTMQVNALGTLRILEAIMNTHKDIKFYNAATSELFGGTPPPQDEGSPFWPNSPYAASKLAAFHLVRQYREAYGMFAVNGILFNHESPHRAECFVTRKVTMAVAKIAAGKQQFVELGNLDAARDWGHAEDYVRGMWQMLQRGHATDYVLATGKSYTVRQLVDIAFKAALIPIRWVSDDIAVDTRSNQIVVKTNPQFLRPLEVNALRGIAKKAEDELGWTRKYTFEQMITEMVHADLHRNGMQPPA